MNEEAAALLAGIVPDAMYRVRADGSFKEESLQLGRHVAATFGAVLIQYPDFTLKLEGPTHLLLSNGYYTVRAHLGF